MVRLSSVAISTSSIAALHGVDALRTRPTKENMESYSFDTFVNEFARSYQAGSTEYKHRSSVFAASLAQINSHNSVEGRTWTAGLHRFMDWDTEERRSLHGYKPSRKHAHMAALQTETGASSSIKVQLNASFHWGDSVSNDGISPELRNQGNCGSCWAISAAEAAEAQLAKSGGPSDRLSAQALVDCVPNPQHCGGSGGCDGATGELAYSYMKDFGIPFDSDLPYDGRTDGCPSIASAGWGGERVVKVEGWTHLTSNKGPEPLMQSLVQNGPTVIAVDANDWFDYDTGVFNSCSKDAELGHAVLAKGYGEENGNKYWTIQNSWGAEWGEHGHIRIKRTEAGEQCGMDKKPSDGEGCDGGPAEVEVCGMCGIEYDPVIPYGVHVVGGSASSEVEMPASMPAVPDVTTAAPADAGPTAGDVDVASEGMSSDEQKQLQTLLGR